MVTYTAIQDDTTSDLAPSWPNTTLFDNDMSVAANGTAGQVISLAVSEIRSASFISIAGEPNNDSWEDGGTWTVEITITTANMNIRGKCRCVKLDSSGNILGVKGAFTAFQTCQGSSKTFSPVAPTWTGTEACSNRMAIEWEWENIDTMMSQSATIATGTTTEEVITDITQDTGSCLVIGNDLKMVPMRDSKDRLDIQQRTKLLVEAKKKFFRDYYFNRPEYTSWHFVLGLDIDVVHTTDTLVKVVDNDVTHTTDILVQVVDNDLIHTTDLLVQQIDNDLTHSTDVFVKHVIHSLSVWETEDGIGHWELEDGTGDWELESVDPKFSMTVIRNTEENRKQQELVNRRSQQKHEHLIKSLYPFEKYDTIGAIAGPTQVDKTHTTDTLVKVLDNDLIHTTDTLVKVIDNDLTHTTDVLVQQVDNDLTHTTDVLVKQIDNDLTQTTDVLVIDVVPIMTVLRNQDQNRRNQELAKRKYQNRKQRSVINVESLQNYTNWHVVEGLNTDVTHTTDTLIQVVDNDLTHTTDTLVQVVDNDLIHTTDVLIQVVDNDLIHTTDTFVEAFNTAGVMTVLRNAHDNLRQQEFVNRKNQQRREHLVKVLYPFERYTTFKHLLPDTIDKTHTTDTLIKAQIDLTHTTDTLVKVIDNDLTHTTDTLVQVVDNDLIHTTDVLIFQEVDLTHTTDCLVIDLPPIVMTIFRNSDKQRRKGEAVNRSVQLRREHLIKTLYPFERYTEFKHLLPDLVELTHTTDALVKATIDLIHSTDTLIQVSDIDKTHTTDVLIFQEVSLTHTTDILVKATISLIHTTDTLVKVVDNDRTHTTDTLVQVSDNDLIHTTDTLIFQVVNLTHTTDVLVQETIDKTHSTDVLVQETFDKTHITDTLVQVVDNDRTHTTDTLIKAGINVIHTTDTLVIEEISITHTTDVFVGVGATNNVTHTTDILIKAVASQSSDVIIPDRNIDVTLPDNRGNDVTLTDRNIDVTLKNG